MLARFVAALVAMAAVVTASNILVLYPVDAQLGPVNLKDLLTWGAFTYPFAFLVTDLTNRFQGAAAARKVVLAGFVVGVAREAISEDERGRSSTAERRASLTHGFAGVVMGMVTLIGAYITTLPIGDPLG